MTMLNVEDRQMRIFSRLLIATLSMFLSSNSALSAIVRDDNSKLSKASEVPLYEWKDDSIEKPQNIIVAVHGFAQDGTSLASIAHTLALQGFLVIAPDLRGHGRWKETDSTMESNLQASCEDVEKILEQLHKKYKKANIFCLGESTGCGVILSAVAKQPEKVRGVILCAAGSQPSFHNPTAMGSSFIKGMATLVTQVDIRNYLQHYLSDDQRVAAEMIQNPLTKKTQSAMQLLGTMNFIREMPHLAEKLPSNIAVLFIQGAKDQIVLPNSAQSVFESVRSSDKKFVPISDSGHILIGTAFIKPEVLSTIESWLAKHANLKDAKLPNSQLTQYSPIID